MAQSKGLLGSLFDLSFRHYATPHIVRIVYILLMVLVGLGAIGGLVTAIGLFRFSPLMGLLYLIATPVVSVVFLALCRMSMEMYVAICRAAEDLDQLKRKLGN